MLKYCQQKVSFIAKLAVIFMGLYSSNVFSVIDENNAYITIGTGKFTYLFWHIYDARLASKQGDFVDYKQSTPLLLELTYLRDIKKQDFIDATVGQWQKLDNCSSEQQQNWAKKLSHIWVDIKQGDQLAAVLTTQGSVRFLFNQQEIGTVEDKAFGPAFFDIWLSPNTTAKKLRGQLLAAQ